MKKNIFAILFIVMLCQTGFAAQEKASAVSSDSKPEQQTAQEEVNPPTPAEKKWPTGPAGEAAEAYSKGDYRTARHLWEQLAEQGDAQAMNNLGVLYDTGKGVDIDAGRAAHWFAQAANGGNPAGMSNYGRMLEQGRGIAANVGEAARWFDQAARAGQPEAQYNLGYLYEHGHGINRDDAAAAAWYSRAAAQRQKDALARLGHFYRIGKGVEQNRERATLLLYAAAMEGSQTAISELEELAKESPQKAQAILFGQQLNQTTRPKMREALKKAGAKIINEKDSQICDVYEGAPVIPGASEMSICYANSGELGFIKIDYAADEKSRADAVIKMVENRFGAPSAGEGEDSRLWNLGSILVATQYAPAHRQISLMYMAPQIYHLTKGVN